MSQWLGPVSPGPGLGVSRAGPRLSDALPIPFRLSPECGNSDLIETQRRAPACRVQGEKSWAHAAQEGGSGIEPVETLESPVLL